MPTAIPTQTSPAELLASLPPSQREAVIANLSREEASALLTDWRFWARPKQLAPPGDWLVWLILSGRGWGKTRTGANWALDQSRRVPRLAIVAATFGDGRDTAVEGEGGLRDACPDLDWNRSMGEMRFPSGCRGKLFSGEEPDRLRGPNNYAAWCDELGSWRYQQQTWDQLQFTIRKGESRICVTTTPRPTPLIKQLLTLPTTHVTKGHTDENRANLSPAFMRTIVARYEGTRLGRQELAGEILDDAEGALWRREWIETHRATILPEMRRVVVGVDPSVQGEGTGDACGIVVAGMGTDGHGYVLADYTLNGSPLAWAQAAVSAYAVHKADALIAEANQGGALVQVNIGRVDGAPPVKLVHASRGKQTRAEPIANLYEQGRIHHAGALPALEDEMCAWVPDEGKSPNRIDAAVWALSELAIRPGGAGVWFI